MARKPPARYTPRNRGVEFSQSPATPGGRGRRGRLIQLSVTSSPAVSSAGVPGEAPDEYHVESTSARVSQPPRLMDADVVPMAPMSIQTPVSLAQRARASVDVKRQAEGATQAGVQALIMHAVSGWVAVVRERRVYSLQIAPLGRGNFEVEVRLLDGDPERSLLGIGSEDPADTIYLLVSCALGKGRLVRTEVEPLGPRLPRM